MAQPTEYPIGPASGEDAAPNPLTILCVKEIFVSMSKAISALKLFPDNNEMVIRFRRQFASQLMAFLASNPDLEVEIRQNAFQYQGGAVFQEGNVIRSLPYLFFKDGMKKLTFLAGISQEEIAEFLDVVRTVSLLPLEVSDIVDALWQKDFANIHFFASDEFLESKIPVDHKIPPEFRVSKEDLIRGRLDLRPEDTAEAMKAALARGTETGRVEADSPGGFAALDALDLKRLDSLVTDEHRAYEEKEFLGLVFELLLIEERPEAFSEILAYLNGHHAIQIQNLDFVHAAQMVKMLEPLSRKLAGSSPERIRIFERFRADLGKNCLWAEVRKAAVERRLPEPARLFDYLGLLGPIAFPLASDLYEDAKDPEVRRLAQEFFEKMGRIDPVALTRQGPESRPVIAKLIIGVLGQLQDPRTIPGLAAFLEYQDASIRVKTVRALGGFAEEQAHQILGKCLRDPSREVRIETASQIRIGRNPELIQELIRMAGEKPFDRTSETEAAAILTALGKSESAEAGAFLASLLRKRSFFGRAKLQAVQLGAVRALSTHGGPAAVEALRACARRGRRKLRLACREALKRFASPPAPERIAPP